MRKSFFLVLSLAAAVVFTGCKSRESAFQKAYAAAKDNNTEEVTTTTNTVATQVVDADYDSYQQPRQAITVTETPAISVTDADEAKYANVETRTIDAKVDVISGDALKMYSVVVGSFQSKTNAEALKNKLQRDGYDSRVVFTNETINGLTNWYRVVATSSDSKAAAGRSRDQLRGLYKDAWILRR